VLVPSTAQKHQQKINDDDDALDDRVIVMITITIAIINKYNVDDEEEFPSYLSCLTDARTRKMCYNLIMFQSCPP